MQLTSINREIREMVDQELAAYPVDYFYDMKRGNNSCVLNVKRGDGAQAGIRFHPNASGNRSILNIRAELRRELKSLGLKPRAARPKGTALGDKILEAAAAESRSDQIMAAITAPAPTPVKECAASQTTKDIAMEGSKALAQNGKHPPQIDVDFTVAGKIEPNAVKPVYQKLRQEEVVQVTLLISQNARIDHAGKIVTYNDNWNDKRISDIIRSSPGRDCITERHVVNLRRESLGMTPAEHEAKTRAQTVTNAQLLARIEQLEERCRLLEEAATKP